MIGALLAGWDEVVGIEKEEDYAKTAEARLTWWQKRLDRYGAPLEPKTVLGHESQTKPQARPLEGQMELF